MNYTREQIAQMNAGQGLDRLIHIHLFGKPEPIVPMGYREGKEYDGWATVHVGAGVLQWWAPAYSTNFELAWKAAMRSEGSVVLRTDKRTGETRATAWNSLEEQVNKGVVAPTPMLAICRAVLMTCFL